MSHTQSKEFHYTSTRSMETVLVVGATGNIGVSAVKAALHSGRHVLAIVRNQDSAEKLFLHVGTQEGISTVEADILSEHGVQGVVDKVESGHLPAFQHVYGAGVYSSDILLSFG
jgi:NAD(P)-dependent dehydrogenase (short-subunit alcohol dehydrogenase family)